MSTIVPIRLFLSRAAWLGALAVLLLPPVLATAQTLYVDDNAPVSCPCVFPAQNNDETCGQTAKPFSCIRDAVSTALPFDTVIVRDGTYIESIGVYQSGTSDTQRKTIRAENIHGALISAPNQLISLYINANYVTVQGFRITAGGAGLYIAGADPGQTNAGRGVVAEDLEVFGNSANVHLDKDLANVRLSRLDVHHSLLYDGIKLDTYWADTFMRDTLIEDSHIHHNNSNGLLVGNAERTVIRNCEVDNNGASTHAHGFYMKDFEGLIQNNKVHHNSGYGIHLWAAPRGSATRHYIVEGNDTFANGSGGIVLGGSPFEASPHPPLPPGDGYPHYVEIRYNSMHHNNSGFVYYGAPCDAPANDNSFHHNTVYNNNWVEMLISGLQNDATTTRLLLKNNIVVGRPYTPGSTLVHFISTDMDSGALDGNVYYVPGAGPDTTPGVFAWECYACEAPPDVFYRYSFDQIRNPGILQDNTRRPDLHCGPPNTTPIDLRSQWTDPLLVDPGTSAWSSPAGMTVGDFHLRRGSPAASGGVCCDVSNAGSDVDGEAVPICSPTSCDASVASVAVGADYPLDDNADGIANRYECAPPDGTLCDGDTTAEAAENACLAGYPGAPYDPAVFPSNPEVCDGKDNDCNSGTTAGGGESDLDHDGYYAPCGLDCNDADMFIYPAAREICDGLDNNCAGGIDEGYPDSDGDSLRDCVDPGADINIQVTPTAACPSGTEGCIFSGSYTDLNASSPNNTREVLSEQTTSGQRKLTKIWTLNNVQSGTYELRVEGHRTAGGNKASDNFNFAYVTKASGSCSTGDAFGSTILTVSKPADDDQLQIAFLGVLTNPVVCLRVQDSNRGNDSQSDLLHLDRVFLYKYPPCVDNDGDGYAASCSACVNTFCPTIDCDDGDVLESPGLTEGPYGTPTCSDAKDNNCNGLIDAADTAFCSPTQYVLVEWPNSDAGPNQGTPSPAVAHYLNVDDDPHDGDTSTLSFSGGGYKEVYTTADQVLDTDIVSNVKVRWAAKKGSGSGWSGKAGVIVDGTEYYGPTRTLTTNYSLYEETFANNPATSQAWTVAAVRAAKLIYQQVTINTQLPRAKLTEIVLVVTVLR